MAERRSRFTQGEDPAKFLLTTRDVEIICACYDYRFVSWGDISEDQLYLLVREAAGISEARTEVQSPGLDDGAALR